jgi:hypothetical protein
MAAALVTHAATRPHYGGTLRVEVRQSIATADPPQSGPGMGDLSGAFSITRWEGGRLAVYSANDDAPSGRPFVDNVEVQMGRSWRDQAIDLEVGKADIVELGPMELRRPGTARKTWTSAPVRLFALVFAPRVTDSRVREALALAVDRGAIHSVLLQRQGEISGGLLPQWISGYAFLFPAVSDTSRARNLTASLPVQSRALAVSFDDAALRPIAERIALNARDGGLAVTASQSNANADVRLVEARVTSTDPYQALVRIAATLGLPEPPRADTPEALFAAERALLEGFRVIPLFHVPDVYGVSPRVRGSQGITPLGEWRFENLWLEGKGP